MGPTPEPGQIRLWAYQALAHGGEGILFFRFMAAPFGMEQYWYGILDQDGKTRRRYAEVSRIGRELQRREHLFMNKTPSYEALIVRDYENGWSHQIKHHTAGFDYEQLLYQYYRGASRLGIMTAVGRGDYRRYKLVMMPAYNVVDQDELQRVTEFVRGGGTLLVTYRSGQRNRDNTMSTIPLPGAFWQLVGVEVEEFDASDKETHIRGLISSTAHVWRDVIRPLTAQVLSSYVDRYFKGAAAITVNDFGKGKVYYVGCDLDEEGLDDLLRLVARDTGVTMQEEIDGVELIRRPDCTILLNHTDSYVQCFNRGITLEDGHVFDGRLAPYGVEILQPEE
ncbi:MAG: beta-galactosidase trimerization domain-containing protein [Butyrivibrio sp.]|nr:beta-galactosidase trimerization domain-containing protein [Butyrivibrio sp.]